MHPFQVTSETKRMVLKNITFLLNNFIHCSAYENIIFCWVMHRQSIIEDMLGRLDIADCQVNSISLICSREALQMRLQKDVDAKIRQPDIILHSLERLPLYGALETIKLDVSDLSPEQAVELIAEM